MEYLAKKSISFFKITHLLVYDIYILYVVFIRFM